ncbi:hypothetical protein HMPREF9120_01682 [Neisseria sp. oral taxon 020 str. F0370]|nr:hypothetical protein HMPREF9120_01682 [Neisseria sp. oral taxon 020 str. F0370]
MAANRTRRCFKPLSYPNRPASAHRMRPSEKRPSENAGTFQTASLNAASRSRRF